MPFSTLGLGPNITKALLEQGYTEPTPIQAKAVPLILSGRDVVGVAQTGTGKTAAFVLPLLQRLSTEPRRPGLRVLIVAPTRELVVQIDEAIRQYARHLDISSTTIYGGVGERPQIAALRRGVDIVVATPGRLMDLMQQRHVDFRALSTLVLDEADRMLDMGFLPGIRRIVAALPAARQTLLFSATLSKEIEAVSKAFLTDPATAQIGARSTAAEAVTQVVIEVSKERKIDTLVHLLLDAKLEMVLVFSRTKHGADKLARRLESAGVRTATLHSNRTQGQRIQALTRFRLGEVRVLVATDIAARGIDVDGISHVVNFDFPPQPEDYVHRIGRTGRAAAIGDAVSLVTPDDRDNLRKLERFLGRGIARHTIEGVVAVLPSVPQASRPQGSRPHGPPRPRAVGGPRPGGHRRQGGGRPDGFRGGSYGRSRRSR
jgi:ATP-dependent RNA helicase RhlE